MEVMKNRWIHYEVWTVGSCGATHKTVDKHDYLSEIIPELVNGDVFEKNKRKLSGINGIMLLETASGLYVSQIGGYNGNDGMYGYLVERDGSLTRFC